MCYLKIFYSLLCLSLTIIMTGYGQSDNYNVILKSIAAKVEKMTGRKYYISGTDIDKSIKSDRRITDPYHTLEGCFIFVADGQESDSRGFVGIYRINSDSIIWCSELLSSDFSALGGVTDIRKFNKNKEVEIVVAQPGGSLGDVQILWIFSWDGKNGKMITKTDENNQSVIAVLGDDYILKDLDKDGINEIIGTDPDSNKTLIYSWNGKLYGDWGKSSRYLLKGKKK